MKRTCKWVYAKYAEMWETECGAAQIFSYGKIKDNNYIYCPYCGREIESEVE